MLTHIPKKLGKGNDNGQATYLLPEDGDDNSSLAGLNISPYFYKAVLKNGLNYINLLI